MHPYAIDSDERRVCTIVLLVVSVLLQEVVLRILPAVNLVPSIVRDFIFDPASAGAILAALLAAYNRWLWKLASRLHISGIPNLNGVWEGIGISSYGGAPGVQFPVTITIKQSWTSIVVELTTRQSRSRSDSASLLLNRGADPMLVYTYWNAPSMKGLPTMQAHPGTTQLDLRNCGFDRLLEGTYYSGRGRGNFGNLRVKQQPA